MLNEDYFDGAVIRLVSLQKQRKESGHLLFSTVSLYPRGRPLPAPMDGVDRWPTIQKGQSLYFRRVLMSVHDAIKWYRGLAAGADITPIPTDTSQRIDGLDGVELRLSSLVDDPTWPKLGLPVGEGLLSSPDRQSHPAPFIGSSSARVHRRFGDTGGFDSILEDAESISFIARRMHVDLRRYREYLGSVALVVADPVIRKIDHFMVPATPEKGERIFFRFVPRNGASLEGLTLTTFDRQAQLLTNVSTQDVPADGIIDTDKGDCIGEYGYVVTHSQHGVLVYSPPHPFLRQINLTIHAAEQRQITVNTPISDSISAQRIEYSATQRSSLASNGQIGTGPRISNVNARIANEASRRAELLIASQFGQCWFSNGSREESMRFIQSELKKAKSKVMIADPYLGGLQLGQFLFAINPNISSVVLLTSKLAFSSKAGKSTKIQDFRHCLDQLDNIAKIPIEAYVLKSSILHDRFLMIDDAVWFLGNSLNTLGEKASLIVKVPNPHEVIQKLNEMVAASMVFKDYERTRSVKKAKAKS